MKIQAKKYSVVIVGIGNMGSVWLNILKNRSDIKILGLVDIDKNVTNRLNNEFADNSIIISDDYKKILDKLKPDFVLDVTPPSVRSKNLEFYLKNNINVLSEKPLVDSKNALTNTINLSKHSKSKLMISQNYRWNSAVSYLRKLINSVKIDSIKINCHFDHSITGWRSETNHIFLLDMAIHHIDLIRYITNSNFEKVTCSDGDATKITGVLSDGTKIDYEGSWKSENKPTGMFGEWELKGNNKLITWDGQYKVIDNGKEFEIDPEPKDKLEISLDKYIHYLKNKSEPAISLMDNSKTLNTVFACIESTESNKTKHL